MSFSTTHARNFFDASLYTVFFLATFGCLFIHFLLALLLFICIKPTNMVGSHILFANLIWFGNFTFTPFLDFSIIENLTSFHGITCSSKLFPDGGCYEGDTFGAPPIPQLDVKVSLTGVSLTGPEPRSASAVFILVFFIFFFFSSKSILKWHKNFQVRSSCEK